jgi:hypothetical protein
MAIADAEGFNAPEGNTRPAAWARRGRSAGVLRPWHAGREALENLGGPRGSCEQDASKDGIQLFGHTRGNPDTERCWNRTVDAERTTGKRRSTGNGKDRCMPLGSRITHSVCLAAHVSGGLKSHSIRGPGSISKGGGNASPAAEQGRYGALYTGTQAKAGHSQEEPRATLCTTAEGRVSTVRWNLKGLRRTTGL